MISCLLRDVAAHFSKVYDLNSNQFLTLHLRIYVMLLYAMASKSFMAFLIGACFLSAWSSNSVEADGQWAISSLSTTSMYEGRSQSQGIEALYNNALSSCVAFEKSVLLAGEFNKISCRKIISDASQWMLDKNQWIADKNQWIVDKFSRPKSVTSFSIPDTIKMANNYLSPNAAWDFVGVENDVSVWKLIPSSINMKQDDRQWPCMKSSTIIKGDTKALIEYLMDSSKVPEYNRYCAGRTDVERLSKKSKIVWNRTRIPLAIKSYDVCTLMHYYLKYPKEYVLVSRGIEHPLIPVHKDFSRSENIIGLNILRPIKMDRAGTYTEITCISHVRYGGTLPYVIQKSIFRGTVKYLHNLKEKVKAKF